MRLDRPIEKKQYPLPASLYYGYSVRINTMKRDKDKVIKQGDVFGDLVVLEEAYDTPYDKLWLCQCSCGLKIDVTSKKLLSRRITKCDICDKNNKTNLIQDNIMHQSKAKTYGLKSFSFGDLSVIQEVEPKITKTGRRTRMFKCLCSCGRTRVVSQRNLNSGKITSCGCKSQTIVRLKGIWHNILCRTIPEKCRDKNTKRLYIDRGITICNEWKKFNTFKEWALKNGYLDILQIDRINNDEGYRPDNCRWVTHRQNSCNKRNSIKLPDGHSFCDLLWNLGILNGTKLYEKHKEYYKKHGELHPDIIKMIDEKHIDIDKII